MSFIINGMLDYIEMHNIEEGLLIHLMTVKLMSKQELDQLEKELVTTFGKKVLVVNSLRITEPLRTTTYVPYYPQQPMIGDQPWTVTYVSTTTNKGDKDECD